jgi:hypothetical protein
VSAPQAVQGETPAVSAAWLVMEAVRAAEVTRVAIYKAMRVANERGVVVAGWPLLQEVDAHLARLVDPQGTVRAIAANEIRATGETP